jgi:ubiquinone/menaquinone biosynthesis C-methylase UbiE
VSAAAFDRVAPRYDAEWTATPVGRAQRAQVWRLTDRLFLRGDCILDVGCGTGEDAAHLAERGVAVHAIDPAPEMVRRAASRGSFTTEVAAAERLGSVTAVYDGALSNFGALNCVEDLRAVAAGLAARVRPGGRVALCVIGRFCLWELLYYAARLRFRKALRRVLHRTVTSSLGVPVHYRSVRELRGAFAGDFFFECWTGIGLLVPPSYVALPAWLVRALNAMDRVVAGWPILRGLADHRLVILVRK